MPELRDRSSVMIVIALIKAPFSRCLSV